MPHVIQVSFPLRDKPLYDQIVKSKPAKLPLAVHAKNLILEAFNASKTKRK